MVVRFYCKVSRYLKDCGWLDWSMSQTYNEYMKVASTKREIRHTSRGDKSETKGQSLAKMSLREALAKAIKRKHPTLEELLDKITPENRHEEVDWGPPVGKEVW